MKLVKLSMIKTLITSLFANMRMIWLPMCILAVGLCIITCKINSIASLKSARIRYLRLLGVVATRIEVRICLNGKGRRRMGIKEGVIVIKN